MGAQGREGRRTGAAGLLVLAAPLLLSLAALMALAAPAGASFHLIKVREVYAGTVASPDSDYVELQMYAGGQNLVGLGELEVLGPTGAVQSQFKPSHNVSVGANQSTVLIVNSGFAAQFPGASPDFADEDLDLNPAGGAVCWPQTEPPFDDCASWGNFSGQASLPSPGDSAPAAAIPSGMALRRTISPGCSTLLENADDSNNSSVDFSAQTPNPRGNAVAPTESECASLPDTSIGAKPANPTKATSASFTYQAFPSAGANFECKLDAAAFSACPGSGVEYPGPLTQGAHSFEVRAVNAAGADPAPAFYSWTVDTTPPAATIKNHPLDPSSGTSAAFTYQSNEVGSKFECSLVSGADPDSFASCPNAGKTYTGLADGDYTFKVRAIDAATNQGPPQSFEWTVDNSPVDPTPPQTTAPPGPADPGNNPAPTLIPPGAPQTTLSGKPAATTHDRTPTFRFRAPVGATFQCRVDSGPFRACRSPFTTKVLPYGAHTFQVRALLGGLVDPSAATFRFKLTRGGGQ